MSEVVLLTVKDAGARMGLSRSAAYRLVASGGLPVVDARTKGAKRAKLRVDSRDIAKFADGRKLEALAS